MDDKINLKDMERKAYLTYLEDGLLEIVIGIFLLFFAFCIFLDFAYMAVILSCMFFLIYVDAKRRITLPRIGAVKFGEARERKYDALRWEGVAIALFLALLLLAIIIVRPLGVNIPFLAEVLKLVYYNLQALFGLTGALLLAWIAYLMGLHRFYAYAAITLVVFMAGELLDIPMYATTAALGAVFVLIGAYVLQKFIKSNPLPKEEAGPGAE